MLREAGATAGYTRERSLRCLTERSILTEVSINRIRVFRPYASCIPCNSRPVLLAAVFHPLPSHQIFLLDNHKSEPSLFSFLISCFLPFFFWRFLPAFCGGVSGTASSSREVGFLAWRTAEGEETAWKGDSKVG